MHGLRLCVRAFASSARAQRRSAWRVPVGAGQDTTEALPVCCPDQGPALPPTPPDATREDAVWPIPSEIGNTPSVGCARPTLRRGPPIVPRRTRGLSRVV